MINIETFKNYIENDKPFVFAKFGDGELLCINGHRGANCDHHPYSPELGRKLIESLKGLSGKDNVFIADWNEDRFRKIRDNFIDPNFDKNNFVDYQILLSLPQNMNDKLRDFYRAIRDAGQRKKIMFIIPKRLNGISKYLAPASTIINIPLINAFAMYDKILETVNSKLTEDCIIITACGMPAKVLIWDIVKNNPNVTCLDFGSAFDPLLVGKTRINHPDSSTVKEFFDSI